MHHLLHHLLILEVRAVHPLERVHRAGGAVPHESDLREGAGADACLDSKLREARKGVVLLRERPLVMALGVRRRERVELMRVEEQAKCVVACGGRLRSSSTARSSARQSRTCNIVLLRPHDDSPPD